MVTVKISEDSRGRLSSFVATGHAGWAEHGSDVVCSAISTLLQSAWLGLSEVAGVDVDADKSSGNLALAWPVDTSDRADVAAIATTTALSLERIAAQYPAQLRVLRERA